MDLENKINDALDQMKKEHDVKGVKLSGGSILVLSLGLIIFIVGLVLGNTKLMIMGLITYPINSYTIGCVMKGDCQLWSVFLTYNTIIITLFIFSLLLFIYKLSSNLKTNKL